MQFWNGDSKIKLSYILRVQATLYENYKGGHMSRTRWNYRYFIRSVVVIMCVVFCVGCQKKSQETDLKTVSVHVCGNVNQPGVYELQQDSRVFEAIEAAGGMTTTAAFSYLNQAELLKDGQQIYVPSQEEVDSGKVTSTRNASESDETFSVQAVENVSGQDDGKVNLNTASKEELLTLNGIGDVRAQAILKYREEHGEFRSIEELMEVEGIKKGTFQKLKDQIKI